MNDRGVIKNKKMNFCVFLCFLAYLGIVSTATNIESVLQELNLHPYCVKYESDPQVMALHRLISTDEKEAWLALQEFKEGPSDFFFDFYQIYEESLQKFVLFNPYYMAMDQCCFEKVFTELLDHLTNEKDSEWAHHVQEMEELGWDSHAAVDLSQHSLQDNLKLLIGRFRYHLKESILQPDDSEYSLDRISFFSICLRLFDLYNSESIDPMILEGLWLRAVPFLHPQQEQEEREIFFTSPPTEESNLGGRYSMSLNPFKQSITFKPIKSDDPVLKTMHRLISDNEKEAFRGLAEFLRAENNSDFYFDFWMERIVDTGQDWKFNPFLVVMERCRFKQVLDGFYANLCENYHQNLDQRREVIDFDAEPVDSIASKMMLYSKVEVQSLLLKVPTQTSTIRVETFSLLAMLVECSDLAKSYLQGPVPSADESQQHLVQFFRVFSLVEQGKANPTLNSILFLQEEQIKSEDQVDYSVHLFDGIKSLLSSTSDGDAIPSNIPKLNSANDHLQTDHSVFNFYVGGGEDEEVVSVAESVSTEMSIHDDQHAHAYGTDDDGEEEDNYEDDFEDSDSDGEEVKDSTDAHDLKDAIDGTNVQDPNTTPPVTEQVEEYDSTDEYVFEDTIQGDLDLDSEDEKSNVDPLVDVDSDSEEEENSTNEYDFEDTVQGDLDSEDEKSNVDPLGDVDSGSEEKDDVSHEEEDGLLGSNLGEYDEEELSSEHIIPTVPSQTERTEVESPAEHDVIQEEDQVVSGVQEDGQGNPDVSIHSTGVDSVNEDEEEMIDDDERIGGSGVQDVSSSGVDVDSVGVDSVDDDEEEEMIVGGSSVQNDSESVTDVDSVDEAIIDDHADTEQPGSLESDLVTDIPIEDASFSPVRSRSSPSSIVEPDRKEKRKERKKSKGKQYILKKTKTIKTKITASKSSSSGSSASSSAPKWRSLTSTKTFPKQCAKNKKNKKTKKILIKLGTFEDATKTNFGRIRIKKDEGGGFTDHENEENVIPNPAVKPQSTDPLLVPSLDPSTAKIPSSTPPVKTPSSNPPVKMQSSTPSLVPSSDPSTVKIPSSNPSVSSIKSSKDKKPYQTGDLIFMLSLCLLGLSIGSVSLIAFLYRNELIQS
jgi:hypothetical protein